MSDDAVCRYNFTLLSRVSLLKGIPQESLMALATRARRRTFPAGNVLVRQGAVSDSGYVLVSGCVRVQRGHLQVVDPVELVDVTAGGVVGVVGLLEGAPQPVTATSLEDTETIELSARALAETLRRFSHVLLADLPALTWRSALSFVATQSTQGTQGTHRDDIEAAQAG